MLQEWIGSGLLRGHYSTDVIDVIDVMLDVDVQDVLSAFNIGSREHVMVNHSEL